MTNGSVGDIRQRAVELARPDRAQEVETIGVDGDRRSGRAPESAPGTTPRRLDSGRMSYRNRRSSTQPPTETRARRKTTTPLPEMLEDPWIYLSSLLAFLCPSIPRPLCPAPKPRVVLARADQTQIDPNPTSAENLRGGSLVERHCACVHSGEREGVCNSNGTTGRFSRNSRSPRPADPAAALPFSQNATAKKPAHRGLFAPPGLGFGHLQRKSNPRFGDGSRHTPCAVRSSFFLATAHGVCLLP